MHDAVAFFVGAGHLVAGLVAGTWRHQIGAWCHRRWRRRSGSSTDDEASNRWWGYVIAGIAVIALAMAATAVVDGYMTPAVLLAGLVLVQTGLHRRRAGPPTNPVATNGALIGSVALFFAGMGVVGILFGLVPRE
jgi:hypothetical protein